VLAAIQVMAAFRWDQRILDHWTDQLGRKPRSAATWSEVFADHPEFFGSTRDIDERHDRERPEQYFLRWRWSAPRRYDPELLRELTAEEIRGLIDSDKYDSAKIGRMPLASDQVGTLLKTAIELHNQAISQENRVRWWLPIILTLVGTMVTLLVALLKR
jgi:hypothetical protein